MIEWDIASYTRKFSGTLAFIQKIDTSEPPKWCYIKTIHDTHKVYNDHNVCLGWVKTEKSSTLNGYDNLPCLDFIYRKILPGFYKHKVEGFIHLAKKHIKSFKIGLSHETFDIRWYGHIITDTEVTNEIDLDSPVIGYTLGETGKYEIFTNTLYRRDKTLYSNMIELGFMEDGECYLKSKKFKPYVEPHLGGKWQIVSL